MRGYTYSIVTPGPEFKSLEAIISVERFNAYRDDASGDDDLAWARYRWNLELVGAVTPLLCDFEVALRNTIHDQLSAKYSRGDWWASPRICLDVQTHDNIRTVLERSRTGSKLKKGSVGPGRVVANLTLGTWVTLLSKGGDSALGVATDYEGRLWRPALRLGFATGGLNASNQPKRPQRKEVHRRASNVQQLRNAAAHHRRITEGVRQSGKGEHEPRVPLLTVWHEAVEMLGWMSEPLAEIHRSSTAVADLLAAKPTA